MGGGGNFVMDYHPIPGGQELLLISNIYSYLFHATETGVKRRPMGHLASKQTLLLFDN